MDASPNSKGKGKAVDDSMEEDDEDVEEEDDDAGSGEEEDEEEEVSYHACSHLPLLTYTFCRRRKSSRRLTRRLFWAVVLAVSRLITPPKRPLLKLVSMEMKTTTRMMTSR